MSSVRPFVLGFVYSLVLAGGASAALPVARDQSNVATTGGSNISACNTASDFVLAAPARIDAAQVWFEDGSGNDNGIFDNFSGEVSVAIFASSTGPGAEIYRGVGRNVQAVDSGLQSGSNDIFVARFDLDPPASLAAGTYWFSVQEGSEFGTGDDGTAIWWMDSSGVPAVPLRQTCVTPDPGNWSEGSADTAFVLYAAPTAWDQSGIAPDEGNYHFLTSHVGANDFDLTAAASFSAADVWLGEDLAASDDGVLSTFSGLLGWAVYANATGLPGSEIAHGDATAVDTYDSGVQASGDSDVARVRFELGQTISLAPGRYWFALHEGGWLAPGDGTIVGWYQTSSTLFARIAQDPNETAPGTGWAASDLDEDGAFVLFESLVFASGFEAGVACAWSNAGGLCP